MMAHCSPNIPHSYSHVTSADTSMKAPCHPFHERKGGAHSKFWASQKMNSPQLQSLTAELHLSASSVSLQAGILHPHLLLLTYT